MKLLTKITIYIIVLILFTLTSCTSKAEPEKPIVNFTAKVACENEQYTVVHSGNSLTSVTYHTPKQLNGLTYTYKNNILSVNYLNLSYTPSSTKLPIKNNATQLYNILASISGDNCYILSTTEDTATYSLPIAELVCDFTTGRIKEIRLKENKQRYIFTYENIAQQTN